MAGIGILELVIIAALLFVAVGVALVVLLVVLNIGNGSRSSAGFGATPKPAKPTKDGPLK